MGHDGESRDTTRTPPIRFALAAAVVASIAVLESALGPRVDPGSHFILMGTAVATVALTAGTLPALLATVASVALSAANPETGGARQLPLLLFIAQAFMLTVIVATLNEARTAARTKSREVEHALREGESAKRLKDEFLATISHELRTPLNAVLGWVHLLRSGKLDRRMSDEGLESIERNVRRQAEMTRELLDASKAMTGRLRVDCRVFALDSCVREAVHAARPSALAKGVHLVTELAGTTTAVLADQDRLRQIIWQLLANAIKFTPRGGRVEVKVEAVRDQARLIVSDNGPGIDAAFLPRVFERFALQDASPTRTNGGLGVGLSLVRELVELHGGTITATNRADGPGAVFTASFPLQAVASARLIDAQPTDGAEAAELDGLRILVFDEDAEARMLLSAVLRQRGAVVRTAASIGDALEALESWRPDVLVSDDVASDHEQYALVGKIRALESEHGGRIPALALTSVGRTDGRLRHLLDGMVSCVPKPFEPMLLTAAIARLAGRDERPVQH